MRAAGAALTAVLLVVTGCASTGDRAAAGQLNRLQRGLYDEANLDFRRGYDPVVLARWAVNDSGGYRPGDGQQFDQRVEALAWSTEDGMDGVVELRLTVDTPGFQATSFADSSYGPGHAQRCVRFHVGAAGANGVERVDCGDRPALVVPPAPPPPEPLDEGRLRAAMKQPSLARATAAARRAFPGLSVEPDVVDGTWVVVVVRERPGLTCMGGTRAPDGKVRVVTAPEVRPGENDCGAVTFVRGG